MFRIWALLTLFVVVLGSICLPAYSQTFIKQIDGEQAFDETGFSVSVIGDLDGDGYGDVISGADEASPGNRLDAGKVLVYSGQTGEVLYRVEGEIAEDFLGWSVAATGDLDGDLIPDFVISAPFASRNQVIWAGVVYVRSGIDGSPIREFEGLNQFGRFGYSVDSAGDVNGDGTDDLVIGAPFESPGGIEEAGRIYVVSGIDGSLLFRFNGEFARDNFGFCVSGAGDVNGDGFADIVAGSPGYDSPAGARAGSAYVILGPLGTLLHRFVGVDAGVELGTSVSDADDVDRNTFPDVVIGAPKASDGGLFRAGHYIVYDGFLGTEIYRVHGRAVDDRLGISVSGVGDVDDDGFPDVAGGAYLADPQGLVNAGEVIISYGPVGAELRVIEGFSSGIRLGYSVSGGVDLNGDTYADVITGADELSPGGSRGAGATLFYTGENIANLSMRGNVDLALGSPEDVLSINGSAGTGPFRDVVVDRDDPLEIFMANPPSKLMGTSRYCLYFALGTVNDQRVRRQEVGGLFFGHMAFATPMNGVFTDVVKIVSNLDHRPILGTPDFIPPVAPTVVASRARAARVIVLTAQGFIVNDESQTGLIATTNGITFRIQ